jgi:hypothetical protein
LRAAWLAILLGLLMEALVVMALAGMGPVPKLAAAFADTVQKTSWSLIVCAGLAIGAAAARTGSLLSSMSLAGLLAAPLGFVLARALHRGAASVVSLGAVGTGASPVWLAILKAVEYGVLGALLGRAADRGGARLGPCLGYGFIAGIVFGGIALWLMQPMPAATLVARAVNEMLFPVGCSGVLYASRLLERRIGGPA